jgi:hypothetical protein
VTALANQVLAYIEQQGHVGYDDLKRWAGDDLYRVLNELQLAGKVYQTASGAVSARQYQQNRLDEIWENKLEWERYERKRAEARSCHRGPGDPDWEYVK